MAPINMNGIHREAYRTAVKHIEANPIECRCPKCGKIIYLDSPTVICPHCNTEINAYFDGINFTPSDDENANNNSDSEIDRNAGDETDVDASDDSAVDLHTEDT